MVKLHCSNFSITAAIFQVSKILGFLRYFCFLQKIPDVVLSEEMIAESLSLLCKTGDGLAHAYVRLDVHEK